MIFLEHISSIIVSILFWKFYAPILCFILILISGAMNFIFNDFYAIKIVHYLSLSGFISTIQLIFRILEIVYSLKKRDYWIILQFASSIIGILFVLNYICKFIKCPCLKDK